MELFPPSILSCISVISVMEKGYSLILHKQSLDLSFLPLANAWRHRIEKVGFSAG